MYPFSKFGPIEFLLYSVVSHAIRQCKYYRSRAQTIGDRHYCTCKYLDPSRSLFTSIINSQLPKNKSWLCFKRNHILFFKVNAAFHEMVIASWAHIWSHVTGIGTKLSYRIVFICSHRMKQKHYSLLCGMNENLYFYLLFECVNHCTVYQWPLLLTWFNFNLSMDK